MGQRAQGPDDQHARPGPLARGQQPAPVHGPQAPSGAGTSPVGERRRVDRVLSLAYVADLPALPLPVLQARREEAAREEAELSFERRLLQGRLDILRALDEQRRSGGPGENIVERLAQILADDPVSSRTLGGVGLPPPQLGPRRRLPERAIDDIGLVDLDGLDDAALAEAILRLQVSERMISELRARVHSVLEALAAELGARYLAGAVDPAEVVTSRPAR